MKTKPGVYFLKRYLYPVFLDTPVRTLSGERREGWLYNEPDAMVIDRGRTSSVYYTAEEALLESLKDEDVRILKK